MMGHPQGIKKGLQAVVDVASVRNDPTWRLGSKKSYLQLRD